MDITIEKLDDINFVVSGSVDNSVIEQKAELIAKKTKEEYPDNEVSIEQTRKVAAEEAFREFIDAAVKKAGITIDDLLGQPGLKKYEKKEDKLFLSVEIAISPEINFEGVTYDDITPSYTKPKASAEAIEAKLEEFAIKQAPFTALETPRAVEDGDFTVIDFTGYVDGVEFEGGKANRFNLQIGSQSFIEGFEDQLIGMEYDEQRTIKVTFPTNYSKEDLAGKEAEFVVKLHEIQEKKPITIDDDYARRMLKDPESTLESLKEKFSDQIVSEQLSELYVTELKPVIVEGLLKKFDFTLPNNVVEQEIFAKTQMVIQTLPEEEQVKTLQDKDKLLAIRESVKDEAVATIKKAIIVEALAKEENLEATEQEAISALSYQAMTTGQNAQELVQYYQQNKLLHTVQLALLEDKLFGKMLGFDK